MRRHRASVRLLLCLPALFVPAAARAQTGQPPPRAIDVVGTGEVKVEPDEITITAGVETYGNTLDEAKSQNDERIRKLLAAIEQFKIEPKDVQTGHMQVSPQYEYQNQRRFDRLLGFTCNKQVSVVLHDPARLDELVATLLQNANELQGVSFGTSKLREHRDEARKLALLAAREKAQAMAATLDAKAGKVMRISEQSAGWYPPPMPMANALAFRGGEGGDAAAGPTFALGQVTISATVNVTFELE